MRGLAVLLANYLAERKSVRYSDRIVTLSERDSRLLHRIYGRRADHVSPMALQDKLRPEMVATRTPGEKFVLFVGGAFYANRAGIAWFVKNVAPRIPIKTCIVGKGLEGMERQLAVEGKVEVVGEVKSLAEWYANCEFVVAPIFDGSGMKTKVAEALMFGKKIIGTPEAFSGYEALDGKAGPVCVSADEFIAAIKAAASIDQKPFDGELRAAYESTYSFPAAKRRLEHILSESHAP